MKKPVTKTFWTLKTKDVRALTKYWCIEDGDWAMMLSRGEANRVALDRQGIGMKVTPVKVRVTVEEIDS